MYYKQYRKRRNSGYQHFLLFPHFLYGFFRRVVKTQNCWKIINFLLTVSQTRNFRLFQTERVCRGQFQIKRDWQKDLQTGRKHWGKRRNCSLRAISPFPTLFSKDLYCRQVKTRVCLGKG